MQFLILTRRDPRTDFRRALATALRDEGYYCYTVLIRQTIVIHGPREDDPQLKLSPLAFLKFLYKEVHLDETVIIDSLNLGDPLVCVLLRTIASRSVWAYDVHDNLLYDLHGAKRLIGLASLKTHLAISSFTFHAARTLVELFPKSKRLGNASHLTRRNNKVDNPRQILILASVDERFDFDLVEKILTENDVELHIYGGLAEGSTSATQVSVKASFERLRGKFRNLIYYGRYTNDQIVEILDRYQIMLAPYRVNDGSTRYIEPLRYYHALNRGLEVISTSIPAVQDVAEYVHVIDSAAAFSKVLCDLSENAASRRNVEQRYVPVSWSDRARSLVTMARSYEA